MLMRRSKALELKQPILAKYVDTAMAGLPPRIMGIGPVFAIPKLLARYSLSLEHDIDVVEINEACALVPHDIEADVLTRQSRPWPSTAGII